MDIKYISLFKLLLEADDWMTSKSISISLNLSVRSVKSYIMELNSLDPDLIFSSSKGYRINYDLASTVLRQTRSNIPQTPRERAIYLVIKVIKSSAPVSALDMCEELFISYSSFRQLLPKIKQILSPYDLTFEIVSDFISITGMEKNIRKLLSNILHREYSENFFDFDIIQNVYTDIDVQFIRSNIINILMQNHYFINDFSLVNLVMHIVIIIDRINNKYFDTLNVFNDYQQLIPHEYKMAEELIKNLEEHFHLEFKEPEYNEISFLFISRIKFLDYRKITISNLDTIIGCDCMNLVKKMITYISEYYDVHLNEPEFMIRFALHIRNLLMRSEKKQYNVNPLTENIKVNCPLIYDNSVALSEIIKDHTGISINDDEIAYIAFHIGSALSTTGNQCSKITCVLYCPTSCDEEFHLSNNILEKFEADIVINAIVSNETDLLFAPKSDLIIAVLPVNSLIATPKVQVQPFLTTSNVDSIRKKIDYIKLQKERQQFEENLQEIFKPELYEYSTVKRTKDELIHYLCKKITELGYVDDSFENDVRKREEYSSTGYENFAIPHTMSMKAKKTGIFVYISNTPIIWDDKHEVFLVIMLFFNKSQRDIFNNIFEPLTNVLTNNINVKKAITITDYRAFISFLSNCI